MRIFSSLQHLAAALLVVLLPFVVGADDANAQNRVITNVAQANWQLGDQGFNTDSNAVEISVQDIAPTITTYRPAPTSNLQLVFQSPQCTASQGGGSNNSGSGSSQATLVEETNVINAGQNLLFEVNAFSANTNPNGVDQLTVEIETDLGDLEEVTIFETGPNTGIFIGQISTQRLPPVPTQRDCWLSLGDGNTIKITASRPGEQSIIVTADVDVLADPFGIVFDSETGEAVSGATVTLIDVATGQPATVFAEDGVTSWPSTVISGQAITDGAGNVFQMAPGEYWFPLTSLGSYRLQITPPDPYTAPSVVQPSDLAQLTRPGGGNFVINEGSFGGSFDLLDTTPIQVDIPLDRPSADVTLVKTASRQSAQPGDIVFYTVTVQNPDPNRIRRNVTIVDNPSRWLRLRTDTIRINGEEAPNAVTTSADGREVTFALGDIPAGQSSRLIYGMVVRADAPPGDAVNEATATDSLGRTVRANASVDIERDSIADRMTIIGRVTGSSCRPGDNPIGIPGVRVMMEDGSFAITDRDGRYHFEGVVPGTHVVQVSRMTLPEGAEFIDCQRSTRSAGSAISRFVIGRGGSLQTADFHARIPVGYREAMTRAVAEEDADEGSVNERDIEGSSETDEEPSAVETETNSGAPSAIDWLALGDGPDGWLTPEPDSNPRAPSIRVAIRHRKGQSIALRVDGEEVNPLAFEGVRTPDQGRFAVSEWRGVPLRKARTLLSADILNSFGGVNETIEREVFFSNTPTRVEFVPEKSNLIADGRTNPVVAIRVLDRNNRPLRQGVSGDFQINAPYQSAEQIERQQLGELTGAGASSARWVVKGDEGIALIELAPTMVSGSLRLDFRFDDGEVSREQEVEAWLEPGDIEWTIVGLVEGSVGARDVADNMERAGRFDSDLGDNARVALYAKGRVLGKYLVTLAYDSAKQREDQRVLGAIDPNAYYTVFGDGSSRRFDAASREKLYVRIETSTFYALYGDFETGFDQTNLTRYNRTATGVKGEARLGAVRAQGFAAEVGSAFRRDEIQGQGISGPYSLSSSAIIANSEKVSIETRDRFRSELVVSTRQLVRFLDYNIDLLSGTITFKEPVLSRDFDLNPQFIVVEYEIDGLGNNKLNAGLRVDWTDKSGDIRVGVSGITDQDEGERTNLGGVDLRARLGDETEVRAEFAVSERENATATGWMVEAQHRSGKVDVLAYARSLDADFGVGQQSGAEQGRRKIGVDTRFLLNNEVTLLGSVWQDDSLTNDNRRRAAQLELGYTGKSTDARLGITHFNDRLDDGTRNKSTVLESGITQRLADNKLELSASTSIALDDAESVDLPTRHRFGARYSITNDVRLVGLYEIADGENIDARTVSGGIEVNPWRGGQAVTSLNQQRIDENAERTFAAFGLAQSLQVTPNLSVDATIDGSRTLNGTGDIADLVNPNQPAASGGAITDNSLFEDFTAVTLGAAWRKDRWSATARAEYRDGEFAERKGATFGAIRQLGEGSIVGSGATWTRAEDKGGASTEILDAAIAFAHRPDNSDFAMLGKLEYRSDEITDAVAGEAGGAGRTLFNVDGDAKSRRLVASLSTNWAPTGWDLNDAGERQQVQRHQFSLFVGGRYNFDRFEDVEYSATSLLVGADARVGIGDKLEIGASVNIRANLDDDVRSYSYGPQIGFSPTKDTLLTVGYNVEGFRDEDFSEARHTDEGFYASVKIKFDADSFGFLGLSQ